jgi:hypothetical protein
MKDWKVFVFIALALAAMPAVAQTHTVAAGDDGWTTPGGGLTYIKLTGWDLSSVFPGGSVIAGTELVNLKGKAIKPASLGSVDTIVRHSGPQTFTFFGEIRTFAVQVVGLSLVSDNDSVGISGYGTYNLEVYLSLAKASGGSMSVKQVNGDGGTFSSSFSVYPVVVFVDTVTGAKVRLDCGAVANACGAIVLNSSGSGWVHTGGPGNFNPANAGVPNLPSGVAFDANGDGANDTTTIGRSNTFIPGFAASTGFPVAAGNHDHADYSSRHITKPPQDCLQVVTPASTTGTMKNQTSGAIALPSPCPISTVDAQPVDGSVN